MKIFTKQALIASLAIGGVILGHADAWGQSKTILYNSGYDDEKNWTGQGNGDNPKFAITKDDATYGTFTQIQFVPSKNTDARSIRTEFLTTEEAYNNCSSYIVEFDYNDNAGDNETEFVFMSHDGAVGDGGNRWNTYATVNNKENQKNYIFRLHKADKGTTYSLNGLDDHNFNITNNTWYHFKLNVDISKKTVTYTVRQGETVVKDVNDMDLEDVIYYLDDSKPYTKGIRLLIRNQWKPVSVGNIEIYTEEDIAEEITTPSITDVPNAYGKNITITAGSSNKGNAVTTYYTIDGSDPSSTNNAGSFTTASQTITVGADNRTATDITIKAITISSSETPSGIASSTVTTGVLTPLATPVFSVNNLAEHNGLYYPVVSASIDNSGVSGTPTATLSYTFNGASVAAGTYTFTSTGTLTVTATADGYASTSADFTVSSPYVLKQTFDFAGMTGEDFSSEYWTAGTYNDINNNWTSRIGLTTSTDCYSLTTLDAEHANNAIDGLNLFTNKTPIVFIGYGLFATYSNGNNGAVTIDEGKADEYAVYEYYTNYGASTNYSVQAANATYYLYRYSDILKNIKIYSQAETVSFTKGEAAGESYTAYVTSFGTDFAATDGVTAFVATSVADGQVTLTEVDEVPAGTAVILKGTQGETKTLTRKDDAAYDGDNLLEGSATATTEIAAADNKYVLAYTEGNFTFAHFNGTLPAKKAYLVVPSGEAKALRIVFKGNASAIEGVAANEQPASANGIFNLNGQRLNTLQRGINIVNGKKVFVK